MMEAAIASRLLNDTTVAGLVSSRVDWGVRKEGDPYPAICLTVISDERSQDYKSFVSLWRTRVQVDCFALTRLEAVQLREAVIAAVTPAGTFYGTKFGRASIDTVRDLGAHTATGFVHRDSIDALIWHN